MRPNRFGASWAADVAPDTSGDDELGITHDRRRCHTTGVGWSDFPFGQYPGESFPAEGKSLPENLWARTRRDPASTSVST